MHFVYIVAQEKYYNAFTGTESVILNYKLFVF